MCAVMTVIGSKANQIMRALLKTPHKRYLHNTKMVLMADNLRIHLEKFLVFIGLFNTVKTNLSLRINIKIFKQAGKNLLLQLL